MGWVSNLLFGSPDSVVSIRGVSVFGCNTNVSLDDSPCGVRPPGLIALTGPDGATVTGGSRVSRDDLPTLSLTRNRASQQGSLDSGQESITGCSNVPQTSIQPETRRHQDKQPPTVDVTAS